MCEGNRSPFYSSRGHVQDWEETLLCGFVLFFSVNVPATFNYCVLMLGFLNTLSLGDEIICYKLLGDRPRSVCAAQMSALVINVPQSCCAVSHSCLLGLAR